MREPVKYPIGEQSFKMLREGGFLYVDKTMHLESLVKGSKYYFLGRPRRFGKSLFLTTLKCFFEGRRELFKGLYADTMEWDWTSYPVLHIDLNIEKYRTPEALDDVISNLLTQWEMEYGVTDVSLNNSVRFANIIRKAYESTGRGVVILVDEYDKPLVGNLQDNEKFDYFVDKLASLYSNFKSSADYIRFVFITGVSRFSHLSIFSGLNNINDISLDDRYSTIFGISEQELKAYFNSGIEALSKNYDESVGNVKQELKRRYDGYRFSGRGEYMYNPYSLLSVLDKKDYRNYWIHSGQTTLLLEQLKRLDVDLEKQMNVECGIEDLQGLDMNNARPTALLYQTGYLTIKDYDPDFKIYKLGIPNLEVREGLFSYIMPYYLNLRGDVSNHNGL